MGVDQRTTRRLNARTSRYEMRVNVELVYARGIAYPLVHNQFVNKGSQWVMLKRTVVFVYALKGTPLCTGDDNSD